jgi:membrane protease subunit (stomatin/prohibitin family)
LANTPASSFSAIPDISILDQMLEIAVPANGQSKLIFTKLVQLDLPLPGNGSRAEVNDGVILLFDDEKEAVDYTHLMEEYAESLKDHTLPQYLAAQDIITAIGNDKFVQNYLQS